MPVIKEVEFKNKAKTSFKNTVDYILGSKHEANAVAFSGARNLLNTETAAEVMEFFAAVNSRVRNPVWHCVCSFRPGDEVSREQVEEAVDLIAKAMHMEQAQMVYALHQDKDHLHLHVVANKVNPETGKAMRPRERNGRYYDLLEKAGVEIDLRQGRQIVENGRWTVNEHGEIIENTHEERTAISTRAKDGEAHQGVKSWETIAQERVGDLLRTAATWTELHEKLAERGIKLERHGKGAVLKLDDEHIVKLSKVDRKGTLRFLENRLGKWQARDTSVTVVSMPVRTEVIKLGGVVPVGMELRDQGSVWEEYTKLREEFFASRREFEEKLKERHRIERDALKRKHKGERDLIFAPGRNWKGKGVELNQTRSILAGNQARAWAELCARQQSEREKFWKVKGRRFPGFRDWLRVQEKNFLAQYSDEVLTSTSKGDVGVNSRVDIKDFRAQVFGNYVAWSRKNKSGTVDFIDYGKRIVMKNGLMKNEEGNAEESVLAAMQLAAQKWGKVRIDGTDERYRQLCVKVAAEHNFKLANEDLATQVEERKKAISVQREKARGRERTERRTEHELYVYGQSEFIRYARAVGAEVYRVTVTEAQEDETRVFVFDRKNDDGWKTADGMRENLRAFEGYAGQGKNVFVTPKSKDKHYIVVDNLTSGSLRQLKKDGYHPACVIEGSPGDFQVILAVSSLKGDAAQDREEVKCLAEILNGRYGDPESSSSIYGHRLPPFGNFNPKCRRSDDTYPETRLIEAEGGTCQKAQELLQEIAREIEQQRIETEKRIQTQHMAQQKAAARKATSGGASLSDSDRAYWKHYEDLSGRWRGDDLSELDGMIGIRMRVTGHSPSQIQSALENNASAMRQKNMSAEKFQAEYRNYDWHRYAQERTDKFVFGVLGERQYRQTEPYKTYLLKVEGRTEDLRECKKYRGRDEYRGR